MEELWKPSCATRAGAKSKGAGKWLITIAMGKATVNKDGDLFIVKHGSVRVRM